MYDGDEEDDGQQADLGLTKTAGHGEETWNTNFYIYRGAHTLATIPGPTHVMVDISVNHIPNNAFFQQDSLMSVALPRDLHQIGDQAFSQCHSLLAMTLSLHLESIGRLAFAECTSLTHIDFAPDSQLKSMEDGCFSGCRSLEHIQLPPSITSLGKRIFYNCTKLSTMDLSACHGLTRIGSHSFGFCSGLKTCFLPAEVTVIDTSAFGQCYELRHLHLGSLRQGGSSSELLTIGDEAFASCRSFKSIALPRSLQKIGKLAFANCFDLITVEFAPEIQLREVGDQIFLECKRLVNIELPEPIAHSIMLKHGTFDGCTDLKERFAPIEGQANEIFLKEALSIRYGISPLHQLCYDQAHYTVEDAMSQFEKILAEDAEQVKFKSSLKTRWIDIFQMTPIHILVASSEGNPELLKAILDHCDRKMSQVGPLMMTEDLWGRLPIHLACLSDSPITMVEVLLQVHTSIDVWELEPAHWKSCIDAATYHRRELLPLLKRAHLARRIGSLGLIKWKQDIDHQIENIETEIVMASRRSISSIERTLEKYEKQETVALLRSAVWKATLLKLREQHDRIFEEQRAHCFIQSGDEITVANILPFLGLQQQAS